MSVRPLLRGPFIFQKTYLHQHQHQCLRHLHKRVQPPPVPAPTPFIPDLKTFLTVIGRGLSQHAAKIPSWEALFTLTSPQFRELGIEPARSRRYLLHWLQRFRNGRFGVGGDCTHVREDGTAELRIVETPVPNVKPGSEFARATATRSAGMRKVVVNVFGEDYKMQVERPEEAKKVAYVSVKGADVIRGPHVEPLAKVPGGARIKVKEGLWEDRRGHKVDGGERRQAEVRAKRRRAERKAAGIT